MALQITVEDIKKAYNILRKWRLSGRMVNAGMDIKEIKHVERVIESLSGRKSDA